MKTTLSAKRGGLKYGTLALVAACSAEPTPSNEETPLTASGSNSAAATSTAAALPSAKPTASGALASHTGSPSHTPSQVTSSNTGVPSSSSMTGSSAVASTAQPTSQASSGGAAPSATATAAGGAGGGMGTCSGQANGAAGCAGSASGGAGGAGGSDNQAGGAAGMGEQPSCPFPTTFEWSSTGPLAEPKSPSGRNFVSLKDFTVVHWNGAYQVYATAFDQIADTWSSVFMRFEDWGDMATAEQPLLARGAVAPTLIYFTPKDTWVLLYQWGFQFATSDDPSDPDSWSQGTPLLQGGPSSNTGPIDQTAICDTTTCYLFFAADNGSIYRSSMPIDDFPATFTTYETILSDSTNNLFEAVQVYAVKGTGEYLMIVEAIGGAGRYFRAFRASDLGGEFTAISSAASENTPFAGLSNVTFEGGNAWTNDISHGDIVRTDPSETQTIDACNLQLLYQGFDKNASTSNYGLIPYRPALLTKTN